LIPLAEERANLEERLDPTVKSALENRIAQIEEQIRSHEAGKPAEMKPPAEDPAMEQQSRTDLELLEELRKERDTIIGEISKSEANISAKQIRAAQANRLLEKLKNLEAEFLRGQAELAEDAEPLGLDAKSLAALTINRSPVETIRDEAVASIDAATTSLDGPLPDGLRAKSEHIDGQIRAVQERLTKPQQDYQDHLERLAGWQARLDELKGSEDVPDSLLGLQADFNALRDVPNRISGKEVELERIAGEIHNLRVAESEFYGELYEPVQKFVTEHPLAQDQLKIEFRVELIEERFVEDFLAHINQHRIGSFMGAEEGRALAAKLAASVEWANWSDVKAFLETLVERLHKRDGDDRQLQLQSQIIKGRTVAELYAWLFSLAYVKPRYILKSDGKRLEQLSPGERGSLLLVFYLLVDDSDLPLIIDQPEANLDNATVAKKLVNCIRHARDRRQVVIVTHNPNLAVVCDAEQIIHASLDIEAGHRVTYTSGALENPIINQFTIDVLEGGRPPFDKRDDTYSVMEH
jgi:DNA repair exonuclease SbcCD ATPase subunit